MAYFTFHKTSIAIESTHLGPAARVMRRMVVT